MNTKRKAARRALAQTAIHHNADLIEQHFEELSQQAPIVEHLTIPGFLRQIDHRWHLDDIRRFGDKVGQMAESMQLAYLTTIDRSLGVIRAFPEPLLRRVYDVMRPQLGWPPLLEAPVELGNAHRVKEALRTRERLGEKLREVLAETDNVEISEAMAKVQGWLESETRRLRAAVQEPAAAVPAG